MDILDAFILGLEEPMDTAEYLINHTSSKISMIVATISLILPNLVYECYNISRGVLQLSNLVQPLGVLLCMYTSYGIFRLLNGQGQFSRYFSATGWVETIITLNYILVLIVILIGHPMLLSLINLGLMIYHFRLAAALSAVTMNVSYRKALVIRLIYLALVISIMLLINKVVVHHWYI